MTMSPEMGALVDAFLEVEEREAAKRDEVLATTMSAGLAFMLACGHLSVDARDARPDAAVVGKHVMLATPEGRIVGCAQLTGVITLQGTVESDVEHRHAVQIRESLQGTPVNRRCLWVFEKGVAFHPMIECEPIDAPIWKVPKAHHKALRDAYAAAKKRKDA